MIKLSKDIKRMLSALAHQDAGKFLSMQEKMQVLDNESKFREAPLAITRKSVKKPASQRPDASQITHPTQINRYQQREYK